MIQCVHPLKRYAIYKRSVVIFVLMVGMISLHAFAAPYTPVGRYLTEKSGPTLAQMDPLQQTITLALPQQIVTTKDAVNYLLSNTGYHLQNIKSMNKSIQNLMKQPIALSDRQLGPMTVIQALTALAGTAYYVVVDPVHRMVSFKVKPKFYALFLK